MQKKEYAVYIGRFQPFHKAHYETLKFALTISDKVIVVIGSDAVARNVKNPWSSAERIAMITSCFSNEEFEKIQFVPVKDYLYNDNMWIANVQKSISELTCDSDDVYLVGHKKDSSSFYLKLFPQWEFVESNINLPIDATKIRESLFRKELNVVKEFVPSTVGNMLTSYSNSLEFERLHEEFHHIEDYKEQWRGAPFPPTFNTTDAIVIKSGHVLVVRRKAAPGKGLIALPGGFLHTDEEILTGCIRELKEETSIKIPNHELQKVVIQEKTFGHPSRSLRGRTITHAFCFDLGYGELPYVKGDDDAEKAWWMPLQEIYERQNEFFDDHYHIINFFASRF